MQDDQDIQFKQLSSDAIDAATEKIQQYRLLNEPENAESICRDILRIDPNHRIARISIVLCLADQFHKGLSARWTKATEVVETLEDEYERLYYKGILCERRARAHHDQRTPQCGNLAYTWLQKAMHWFERAEELRPVGDDSAILRWNTCARMLRDHRDVRAVPDDGPEPPALLE